MAHGKRPFAFDPLAMPARKSYQPSKMTDEQRDAMHIAACDVRDSYVEFRSRLIEGLNKERELCGKKSNDGAYLMAGLDTAAKAYVKHLAHGRTVTWPDLPSIC